MTSLERWKDGQLTTHRWLNGADTNRGRVVTSDRAGNLWAGCAHGLMLWRDGQWTRFVGTRPHRGRSGLIESGCVASGRGGGTWWRRLTQPGRHLLRRSAPRGRAASVDVSRCLEIAVADNGCGFILSEQAGSPAGGKQEQPAGPTTATIPGSPVKSVSRSPLGHKGTGLAGLKRRLARHDGAVEVHSTPGEGTTVRLRLRVFP